MSPTALLLAASLGLVGVVALAALLVRTKHALAAQNSAAAEQRDRAAEDLAAKNTLLMEAEKERSLIEHQLCSTRSALDEAKERIAGLEVLPAELARTQSLAEARAQRQTELERELAEKVDVLARMTALASEERERAAGFEAKLEASEETAERLRVAERQCDELIEKQKSLIADLSTARGELAANVELKEKLASLEEQRDSLTSRGDTLSSQVAELTTLLEQERKASNEKLAAFEHMEAKLKETFAVATTDALTNAQKEIVASQKTLIEQRERVQKAELEKTEQMMKGLIEPVGSTMEALNKQVKQLSTERSEQFGNITESLRAVTEETRGLKTAFRRPTVRGRWGETTLRNVVERSGLAPHCDFEEQKTIKTDDKTLRPDLVVNVPGDRLVPVDSKVPLDAFIAATEAEGAEQEELYQRHTRQLRTHVKQLASKQYQAALRCTPELVVLFVPSEAIYLTAVERDRDLFDAAVKQNVVIATPMTLVALLRAIAFAWNQEQVTQHAEAIRALGIELHERVALFASHLARVGGSLGKAVESYNKAVGSFERRVLVTTRRFEDYGVQSTKRLEAPEQQPTALKLPVGPQVAANTVEPEGPATGPQPHRVAAPARPTVAVARVATRLRQKESKA